MALLAALLAGGAVGATHALETDHVAAIATLFDDERSPVGAATVGASWGVGHSLPIASLGFGMVLLGVRLPTAVSALFEAVVGLLLCYLGARLCWTVFGADRAGGTDGGPAALTDDTRDGHRHLSLGGLSLGLAHSHLGGRLAGHIDGRLDGHLDNHLDAPLHGEAFSVGLVHGVAGSGALVVALVAQAPTAAAASAFLAAFGALSVLTMGGVSLVWGRAVGAGRRRVLTVVAGVFGIAVGLRLLAETVGLSALPI